MKKHTGLWGGMALCAAVVSAGAGAQDDDFGSSTANGNDRRFYVSPMASYTMADDDRTTDDAVGGAFSIGKKMTSGLNLELTSFFQQMDPQSGGGSAAELTGVGAAAMIFPSVTFPNLYGILAVHHAETDTHPTTPASAGVAYDGTVFDSGIGYLFSLRGLIGVDVALRAEARYRMDSHHESLAGVGGKDDFFEGVFNLGVLIPLGSLPGEEVTEAAEPVAVADSDGDGVADDADQCPDTPAGTPVNESGCENDADGDGVVDRLDQCPDTPAGTVVDEKGCPLADPCRAPGPGEQVDLAGCGTGVAVVLKGVTFETGSSRLTVNAKVILNSVADSLANAPGVRVEIGGHTDAQGSDAFNQKLSERRAQAVKDYLTARGIDASRTEARGYGESQPVDSNETSEGRELNRRVEMKILEGGAP